MWGARISEAGTRISLVGMKATEQWVRATKSARIPSVPAHRSSPIMELSPMASLPQIKSALRAHGGIAAFCHPSSYQKTINTHKQHEIKNAVARRRKTSIVVRSTRPENSRREPGDVASRSTLLPLRHGIYGNECMQACTIRGCVHASFL